MDRHAQASNNPAPALPFQLLPSALDAHASAAGAAAPSPPVFGAHGARHFVPRLKKHGSHIQPGDMRAIGNYRTPHAIALVDTGHIPPNPHGTHGQGPGSASASGGAASAFAFTGAVPMLNRLFTHTHRSYQSTKDSAALVLHGADRGDGKGVPAEEADAYHGGGSDTSPMAEVLIKAMQDAMEGPGPFKFRIDTMYTTKSAQSEFLETFAVPKGLIGGALVDVPRIHGGAVETVQDTSTSGLRTAAANYLASYVKHLDEMQSQGISGRTLSHIVSSNIWASKVTGTRSPPRADRVGGKICCTTGTDSEESDSGSDPDFEGFKTPTRKPKRLAGSKRSRSIPASSSRATKKDASARETLKSMPASPFYALDLSVPFYGSEIAEVEAEASTVHSRSNFALNSNHGVVETPFLDGLCVPRAIVEGVDSFLEATVDSNVIVILQAAVEGADADVKSAQAALEKARAAKTLEHRQRDIPRAERALLLAKVHAERMNRLLIDTTTAVRTAGGRLIRTDADESSQAFRSRPRQDAVEEALKQARAGTHPLCNFSDPRYASPQPITAETVQLIRKDLHPSIKLQFWALNDLYKPYVLFPDTVTFEMLLKHPDMRVVNVLVHNNHAKLLRDIGKVGNSSFDEGRHGRVLKGRRDYCTLCGFSFSKTAHTTVSPKTALFQHLEAACCLEDVVKFTTADNTANRRQLDSAVGYRALNRPLVGFFLCADFGMDGTTESAALAIIDLQPVNAETPTGWAVWDPTFPDNFNSHFRRAQSFNDSEETFFLPERRPLVPGIPLYHDAKDGKEALWHIFGTLFSKTDIRENLWRLVHKRHAKNADSLAALRAKYPDGPGGLCFACKLPVLEPSTWKRQASNVVSADPLATWRETSNDYQDEEDVAEVFEEPVEFRIHSSGVLLEKETKAVADALRAKGVVEHHCHGRGDVWYAHEDCNLLMRQSSTFITIECETQDVLLRAAHILCSHDFVTQFVKPSVRFCPDPLDERLEKRYKPIVFKSASGAIGVRFFVGLDKATDSKGQSRTRMLTISLRIKTAVLPDRPSVFQEQGVLCKQMRTTLATDPVLSKTEYWRHCLFRSADLADEWVDFNERSFALTGLWPSVFPTAISYSSAVLLKSQEPGTFCTSIISKDSFQNAKRMALGGAVVIGEATEMLPLSNPHDRSTVRLLLDITANYPFQFTKRAFPLPCKEHEDFLFDDFSSKLADGERYIAGALLLEPYCERIEVSGHWPKEKLAELSKFPPNFEKILISPMDLSKFQRMALNIDVNSKPFERCAGHLKPVEDRVLIMRMAKLWQRLGFVFTKIGALYRTPASYWAAGFAEVFETQRRTALARSRDETLSAEEREIALREQEDAKFVSNSVIGALNKNKSQYTTLRSVMTQEKQGGGISLDFFTTSSHQAHRTEEKEKLASNPLFTGRVFTFGDMEFYETFKKSYLHNQQLLAALFVQHNARCDHLELFYGSPAVYSGALGSYRAAVPGILDAFPNAIVGYGNTDSLAVEVSSADLRFKSSDARAGFCVWMHQRLDLSNVPAESTLHEFLPEAWKRLGLLYNPSEYAGEWGRVKEETGFAGLEALVVNGPNRWGYRVVQHDLDTLPSQRGVYKDVLKSIPKAWKGLATYDDFSKHQKDVSVMTPFDSRPVPVRAESLQLPENLRKTMTAWGNRACIVLQPVKGAPGKHVPFGCVLPEGVDKDTLAYVHEDA